MAETKRRFSELLDRVARGETIAITRRGVPAAMLVPVSAPETKRKLTHDEIAEGFRELRKTIRPDPTLSIRDMMKEGRR
jgi:prevent-host-death family protein